MGSGETVFLVEEALSLLEKGKAASLEDLGSEGWGFGER